MPACRFFRWVPNTLTCGNLLFGAAATVAALQGQALSTLLLIVAAAVCDFFDGFAARLLGASSPIGKELDSLADLISFGLAPAALLYHIYAQIPCPLQGAEGFWRVWVYFPFVLAAFSALRLAKFNLDSRQSEGFLGLPTPACALYATSWVVSYFQAPGDSVPFHSPWFIPIMVLVLGLLLVSEIPMLSFKVKHLTLKDNKARILFLGLALCIVIGVCLGGLPLSAALYFCMTLYIVMGLLSNVIRKVRMFGSKHPDAR